MIFRTALVLTLFAMGCEPSGARAPQQIDATVSEGMGTVVRVTWTTETPTTGYVRFGADGELDRETMLETEPTTEHSATLIGLPPDTQVEYVVVSEEGDDIEESTVRRVRTDELEGFTPEITVEGEPGHFIVMPLLNKQNTQLAHPVVVDPQGRLVWTYTDQRRAQVYRSQLSRDGSGIVYSATVVGGGPVTDSALVRVSWEGEVLVTHEIPFLAHDFVELEDGTLVTLASECRDADGNSVPVMEGGCPDHIEGNNLLAVAPDGTTEAIWSTWDCLDPVEDASNAQDRENWTHANALDYDAERDLYLISMRNLDTIIAVDANTRSCPWALGGVGATIGVSGGRFRKQHQFEWLGDKLLVFDNQGDFPQSRVVEYDFDPATGAQVAREFLPEPELFTLILGDVMRTSDGSTQIFWGNPDTADNTALADLYAPDGSLTSRLRIPRVVMGFSQIVVDPGRPDLGAP